MIPSIFPEFGPPAWAPRRRRERRRCMPPAETLKRHGRWNDATKRVRPEPRPKHCGDSSAPAGGPSPPPARARLTTTPVSGGRPRDPPPILASTMLGAGTAPHFRIGRDTSPPCISEAKPSNPNSRWAEEDSEEDGGRNTHRSGPGHYATNGQSTAASFTSSSTPPPTERRRLKSVSLPAGPLVCQ